MVGLGAAKVRLVYDTAIYGGSDALLKLVAFFTFPLLANALSSSGFGLLELAMTIVSLGGILVRSGMNNSVQRFYWDQEVNSDQKPVLVSTGFYICMILGVICGAITYAVTPGILTSMSEQQIGLNVLGLIAIAMLLPLTQWAQYIQDVIRLHFAPWKFLGFSFLSRALGTLFSVFAVLFWGAGVEGVLLAQALVLLFAVPLGLYLIRKDIVLGIDRLWSRQLLAFGTPFIFTELAYWLFSSIDRWMLASMRGVDEVGLYSVAFRFASLAMFVATAFGMAWSPYAVKLRADYPDTHRIIYFEILMVLLLIMVSVAGLIAMFSGEVLGFFLPEEYSGAGVPLAILCFTTVLQASQQVTAIGISLARRTKIFAFLVWIAAALNVAFNWLLIPHYGVTGAAWGTVIAYAFLSSAFLFFTQRYYPLPISWGRLLWLLFLSCVILIFSVFYQFDEFHASVVIIKISVALVCLFLAFPVINLKIFQELNNSSVVRTE